MTPSPTRDGTNWDDVFGKIERMLERPETTAMHITTVGYDGQTFSTTLLTADLNEGQATAISSAALLDGLELTRRDKAEFIEAVMEDAKTRNKSHHGPMAEDVGEPEGDSR